MLRQYETIKEEFLKRIKKSLFREIESWKMYCETHYLNNLSWRGFKKLSKKSEFYSSFLEHIIGSKVKNMKNLPFLTWNFIYTSITFTDMMAVMALLDLPWQSDQTHRFDPSGERGIEIIPNSNMMIFKKELQNTEFNQNESIMVIHRFFDENNKNSEMKIERIPATKNLWMWGNNYKCFIIKSRTPMFMADTRGICSIEELKLSKI